MTSTSYEAFKYTISDTSNIYIGSKFSYEELLLNKEINFKIKNIVERYILAQTTGDTTIESDLYFMDEKSLSYQTYQQLRAKVKVNVKVEKKHLLRKPELIHEEQIMKVSDLVKLSATEKRNKDMVICELILPKIALLGFTL